MHDEPGGRPPGSFLFVERCAFGYVRRKGRLIRKPLRLVYRTMKSFLPSRLLLAAVAWALPAFSIAQSVLHQPLDQLDFAPSAIGAAPDGSFYVADEATETIQHFGSNGSLLGAFDSPVKGTSYDITGLAVDSGGTVHATWSSYVSSTGGTTPYVDSGFTSLSPKGTVLRNENYGSHGLSGVSVGPGDQLFVVGPRLIATITDGVLEPIAQRTSGTFRNMQIGPDARLYTQVEGFSSSVDVYETDGTLLYGFSTDDPRLPNEQLTGLAVTPSGVLVTDNLTGTVRRFSTTGELLGVGYGVPRVFDLAVSPGGEVIAALRQNRVVEAIGEDRFSADYAGVTRLSESRRGLLSGPQGFWGGMDVSQGWTESSAGTFLVPGAPGTMVDLNLRYVDTGNAVITVFPVDSVTADPATAPMEYMRQAMENGLAHLDLSRPSGCARNPGAVGCEGVDATLLETVAVEAGTEIGFLYLRNQWSYPPAGSGTWAGHLGPALLELSKQRAIDTFDGLAQLSDEEFAEVMTRFLDDPFSGLSSLHPFVSDARANWGRLDQFSFFLSDDLTFLVMEDLSQAGFSDLSYHDATLLIDVRLIPVPEPAAAGLCLLGIAIGAARTPRWAC